MFKMNSVCMKLCVFNVSKFHNHHMRKCVSSAFSTCCKTSGMLQEKEKVLRKFNIGAFKYNQISHKSGLSALDTTLSEVAQSAEAGISTTEFSILPHHVIQDVLQYLNYNCGLDWCAAIAIATVALRLILLPTYILNRGYAIRTHNVMPEQMKLQMKLLEAKKKANKFEHSKLNLELMELIKKHNINPLKGLMYMLPTSVLFCSMFFGIRNLANIPLASLKTGGYFWFQNLSVADPYFVLPIISCSTLYLLIKRGGADAEMGPLASQANIIKYLQLVPFITFPFVAKMPAAIFVYWITNNIITFIFMSALKNKSIAKSIGLPDSIKHNQETLPDIKNVFKKIKKDSNTRSFNERIQQHEKMVIASRKKKHE